LIPHENAFSAPPTGGSVAPMPDLRPITIPAPPSPVLALLGVVAWPKAHERRRALMDAARALGGGAWETLWSWAWAALAELEVPGATAPAVPGTVDPDGKDVMARTRTALEGVEASRRPAAAWVAELIGYKAEGVSQAIGAHGWPRRGQGRVGGVVVTVRAPAEVPVRSVKAAPASPPSGPQPPAKVLKAAGVAAWPETRDERHALSESLCGLHRAAWLDLVRWAYRDGEASPAEAMALLGYHPKSARRILDVDESLADLRRKPGRKPGFSPGPRVTDPSKN
jgi:hypothetical protein